MGGLNGYRLPASRLTVMPSQSCFAQSCFHSHAFLSHALRAVLCSWYSSPAVVCTLLAGFTVAGPARPVGEAVKGMTHVALKCVDFSLHSGTHPRLGVVDHISVHPLRGASLADAADFVRSVGHQLASVEQSESPVGSLLPTTASRSKL